MNRTAVLPAITIALLGALTACRMSGTVSGTVPALPEAWRNASGFPTAAPDKDLSRWWVRFDDPVMKRVIGIALQSSPDIAAAAARVREARALRKAQASILFPTVDASAGRNQSVTRIDAAPDRSGTTYSAGLSASWDADLFGANRQSVAAATAAARSAQEDFYSAQASLAAETALAYVDLRTTERRLEVVRESLATRTETTQLVKWRAQAGEVDTLELRQSESSLETARATISVLEQSAAQIRNRLAVLAGQAPGSLNSLLSIKSPKVPVPERRLAVGIPADTIRQRPDVRSAGHRWVAAVARTRSAQAEQLPSLRLSGSLGIDTLAASKIFNPQSASASFITGLTAPIFNAGRLRAGVEASDAAQEQALQAYARSVLTALSEVEDALIACRRTEERIGILESAAVSARDADALARLRYRTKEADFDTVLDTQRTLLAIEESLVGVRADRASAHIQLYKALGGGWSGQ
ncbi:MAG TPA: efflux transporter outer membrane subunit [Verrucomicrobiales bacterium]|nr:efflux transporter outer membrane subunit [Verrucomicrobiales bacterium]